VLRLWALQILDQKSYTAAVTANQVRSVAVLAPRGQILDRTGRILVGNQVEQQIVLSRYEAQTDPTIIGKVAALVGETPADVTQALNESRYSPYQPVPVLTGAPMATVQYLQQHQADYPGVSVQDTTVRSYPQGGEVASQVLGYVGAISSTELKDNRGAGYGPSSQIGQSGLENEYEPFLRGVNGKDLLSVNAQNRVVGTLHKSVPKEGDILVTNLDLNLQDVVSSALVADMTNDRNTLDSTTHLYPAATDGAAIVMNVNTGAVLAMASWPTYDLNQWIGGISPSNYAQLSAGCQSSSGTAGCPLNNYAIQGLDTPGSTFKLVTATAALQDGVVTPNQYIDDTGSFTVPGCNASGGAAAGCVFHDAEATGAGEVDLQQALTISDDYYFYQVGDWFYDGASKYGQTPIQDVASEYGLNRLTGIDLPNETDGRVDSQPVRQALHKLDPKAYPNDTWYTGDNIEMAFGQGGTVVTPLGVADAYATFANGGTRYVPQIGAALVDPQTDKVVKTIAPQVASHVSLSSSVYDTILAGLEGVVANGDGTAAGTFAQYAHFSLSDFRIAGKTGTADVTSSITKGTDEPNAWFVAFGPIPNPQYVVVVEVDHGGYGAQAAAPAVMNIFNYLVTNPIAGVSLPTTKNPPSPTPLPSNPPAGTPPPTTTTTPGA
jgi:penicillin-binding protein 2